MLKLWFSKVPRSRFRYGPRGILLGAVTVLDGLLAIASLGLYWPNLWTKFFEWERRGG